MKKRYDDVRGREGDTLYDAVCAEADGYRSGCSPLDDYLQRDAEYRAKERAAEVVEEAKADPQLKAWWAGRLHVSQDEIDTWDPAAHEEKLVEEFYEGEAQWGWEDFEGQFKDGPDADVATALGIPGRVTHWCDPESGRWLEVGDVHDACPGCHELFFGDEDIAGGEDGPRCPRCEEPVPRCPGCARGEPANGLTHVTHGCSRERRTEAAFMDMGFA